MHFLAGNGRNLEKEFTDRAIEIYDLCDESTALHLKIEAWHQNNKLSNTSPGYPRSEDVKSILFPRQHLLKSLDPFFTRTVQEVRAELQPMRTAYNELVLLGRHRPGIHVNDALDVYEKFHHVSRMTCWGDIPWPCSEVPRRFLGRARRFLGGSAIADGPLEPYLSKTINC